MEAPIGRLAAAFGHRRRLEAGVRAARVEQDRKGCQLRGRLIKAAGSYAALGAIHGTNTQEAKA